MTAQTYVRSEALQRYLTLATLGLLGEERQAVQDELEEHLLTRAGHLHAFGTPYPAALSQAMRELGPPLRVCAGLFKVYPMPKIMLTTLLASLGLSGMLLAGAVAPRPAELSLPLQTTAQLCTEGASGCEKLCPEADCSRDDSVSLISLTTVRALAEATGLEVEVTDEVMNGTTYPKMLGVSLGDKAAEGTNGIRTPAVVQRGDELYYRASNVLGLLIYTSGDAQFSRLPDLTFKKQNQTIGMELGSAGAAETLMQELSFNFLEVLLPEEFEIPDECLGSETCPFTSPVVNMQLVGAEPYRVQTALAEGEVVLLAMPLEPKKSDGASYAVATAPVDAQGWAEFQVAELPERIVVRREDIFAKPENIHNALLVRVTNTPLNNLASGIIQPQD